MCYSAAPSTTNQNATQGIYKGYKVARKSLQAYSIKMQYEIVLKVIGCSCYTCLPRTAPVVAQIGRKTAAPGTSTGAPQMDQRLLTNTWPKTRQQHKHTCKQRLTLRNSTIIHKNSEQNYARTILRVTTMLKRSQNAKTRPKTRSRGFSARKTKFPGLF